MNTDAASKIHPVNLASAPVVRAANDTSIILNRVSESRPVVPTLAGAVMAEPSSSAAGGLMIWKAFGGLLAVGVIASGLGFLVLLPKTPREAAVRIIATMAGSALLGPLFVAAAYSKWPEVFAAGASMAQAMGMDNWMGMFMVAAPLLAMAGLPFWWLLGAAVLWFESRKGKDLGQLAAEAKQDVRAVLP